MMAWYSATFWGIITVKLVQEPGVEKGASPRQLSIEICGTSTQAQDLMRWIFNRVMRFLEAKRMRGQTDMNEMISKGVIQSLKKEKKEIDDGRIEDCCLLRE